MSFASLLTHRLAIVTPVESGDPEDADDLDDYGKPTASTPEVTVVWGLVQPRTGREAENVDAQGVEISDHVIFLPSMVIGGGAYITDSDGVGVLAGGRRFNIYAVRSFEFGSQSPHLEVDCRLIGRTEGPALGS